MFAEDAPSPALEFPPSFCRAGGAGAVAEDAPGSQVPWEQPTPAGARTTCVLGFPWPFFFFFPENILLLSIAVLHQL